MGMFCNGPVLFEHPKHMLKVMDKKIVIILRCNILFICDHWLPSEPHICRSYLSKQTGMYKVHCSNISRITAYFAIDHNTKALIVLLIARFGLIRQKHVSPIISLVTHQG